jgi:hypothetical protein
VVETDVGKRGVLRQEAVAGVQHGAVEAHGGRHNVGDVQVPAPRPAHSVTHARADTGRGQPPCPAALAGQGEKVAPLPKSKEKMRPDGQHWWQDAGCSRPAGWPEAAGGQAGPILIAAAEGPRGGGGSRVLAGGLSNADGLVGQLDVEGVGVNGGVDGHHGDVHLAARADDAHRNLPAVRHQHLLPLVRRPRNTGGGSSLGAAGGWEESGAQGGPLEEAP